MSNNANFFEPDALLPEQFFSAAARDAGGGNEKQLMLAILSDAVECHQKYALTRNAQNRELYADAHEWIFSTEREWPFSYENICDVLGIDPDYVRSALSDVRRTRPVKTRKTPRIVSVLAARSELRDRETEFEEALPRAS